MSALSEALGQGHELTCNGKKYKIGLIDQNVKLAFERKLFSNAREAAKALRDLMDGEQYERYLHQLATEYQTGEFGFESAKGIAFLSSIPGMTTLVSLLASIPEDEAMILVKDSRDEITNIIKLVIKDSYHLTDEDMARAKMKSGEMGDHKKKQKQRASK